MKICEVAYEKCNRTALGCRARRYSAPYWIANIGFDTAGNEPCKVFPISVYSS